MGLASEWGFNIKKTSEKIREVFENHIRIGQAFAEEAEELLKRDELGEYEYEQVRRGWVWFFLGAITDRTLLTPYDDECDEMLRRKYLNN